MNPRLTMTLPDGSYASLEVSDCVELHGQDAPECVRTRAETLATISPTDLLVNPPRNVHFVDLTDFFCPGTSCLPVIGNVMVYRTGAHVTGTYARTLGRALLGEIQGHRDLVSLAPPVTTAR
jgi:hypothetical protein